MSLEISYWAGVGSNMAPIYKGLVSTESLALSGSSAQSGATPADARIVRIVATETARVKYDLNPTAAASGTGGVRLVSGEVIELEAIPGGKIAGIQAS